jgi:ABC-2 type transport system permease protein
MSRAFVAQLGWELRKLCSRPRTYLAFAATFTFELVLSLLLRAPAVREVMTRELWKTHLRVDQVFSGLTSAVHLASESMAIIGALFLGLVTSDVVSKEIEDGTLRTLLCRPVGRGAVFVQKLTVCAAYTMALALFVGASALVLGLAFEGRGPLVIVSFSESILTALDFPHGLARYAIAIPMLGGSMLTVALMGFALSCFGLPPGAVIVVGGAVLIADHLVRIQPGFAAISPYTLTTRLMSWRQMFNREIPWPRLERNYGELLALDVVLIVTAWWTFRRRDLTR